jgi:hypothetical protein
VVELVEAVDPAEAIEVMDVVGVTRLADVVERVKVVDRVEGGDRVERVELREPPKLLAVRPCVLVLLFGLPPVPRLSKSPRTRVQAATVGATARAVTDRRTLRNIRISPRHQQSRVR